MTKKQRSSAADYKLSGELLEVFGSLMLAVIEAAERLDELESEDNEQTESQTLKDLLTFGARQAKELNQNQLTAMLQRALDAKPLLEAMQ